MAGEEKRDRSPARSGDDIDPPGPFAPFLTALCLASFVLNWIWEMAQMPAYNEMANQRWQETLLPCTRASLGDVLATLSIYGIGALAAGWIQWGMAGRWNVYATAALLGVACGAAYEWYSLALDRWTYSDRMPVVPVLGVGLWPLLQLMLLAPASLGIAHWCAGRRSRE